MLGNLPHEQIEDVLKNQLVGRIGCSLNGETYVIPISYAYDGTFIYCHTTEGKKTSIMRQNRKLCFQVDEMKDMANWRSVIVQGEFEEIKESNQRNQAMQTLLNWYLPVISSVTTHLGEHWPFHPEDAKILTGSFSR